jgi:hypothetical protein
MRGGGSMQAETEPATLNGQPEPDLNVHYRRARAPAQGRLSTKRPAICASRPEAL